MITDPGSGGLPPIDINPHLARLLAKAMQVNMHEAKTRLSELVQRSLRGERVVLARNGRPVAEIVPYDADLTPRRGGLWRGAGHIAEDFDDPIPEIEALFGTA